MTSEDVRSELEKQPFIPFRLHLTSGAMLDIQRVGRAFMLQNAVLVLQSEGPDAGYDVVSLRNIERLEQLRPER